MGRRYGVDLRLCASAPHLCRAKAAAGFTLLSPFSPHGRARDGSMLGIAMVSRTRRDGSTVKGTAIVHATPSDVVTFVADVPSDETRWEFPFSLGALAGISEDGVLAVVVQVSDMVRSGGVITVSRFSPHGHSAGIPTGRVGARASNGKRLAAPAFVGTCASGADSQSGGCGDGHLRATTTRRPGWRNGDARLAQNHGRRRVTSAVRYRVRCGTTNCR